jgi:dipeptidase E
MKLLLLSNSSLPGQSYLQFALRPIQDFLNHSKKVAFIPYAAVSFSFEEYYKKVSKVFGQSPFSIGSIHATGDPFKIIEDCDAIMVGGGNTFALLKRIKDFRLLEVIQEKVLTGTPFVGWSAGSNLAGPTICTTNDMPIVDPEGFNSFGFLPFQINPHYLEAKLEGHMGETRDQRLQEYIELNQGTFVVAIPEGSYLELSNGELRYHGSKPGMMFKYGREVENFDENIDLSFLLK